MKIIAIETPKTLEQYQLALDAAWAGGRAYGRGEARLEQKSASIKFNEGLHQEREARLTDKIKFSQTIDLGKYAGTYGGYTKE